MSAALAHLRFGVTVCAIALGIALGGQIAVWAAVYYTDARTTEVDAAKPAAPLKVVTSAPEDEQKAKERVRKAVMEDEPVRADVNRAPGAADVLMRRLSALTQTTGVFAAVLLAVLMFQGVMLAGSAGVPGVEKAVTAATLSFVVLLLCLPLKGLMSELPFRGVFVSYETLVGEAEAFRSKLAGAQGPLAFYGSHLLLPLSLFVSVAVVALRFRSGVEAGIIVTSVSELDEKLEREVRAMKLGQLAMPRAVGALNMAIGQSPGETPPVERSRVAPPAFRGEDDMPTLKPTESTKRPI